MPGDRATLLCMLAMPTSLTDHVARYEAASTRGCMRARNLLAMLYFDGKGVPKRKEKAYDLFKQAAQVCLLHSAARGRCHTSLSYSLD